MKLDSQGGISHGYSLSNFALGSTFWIQTPRWIRIVIMNWKGRTPVDHLLFYFAGCTSVCRMARGKYSLPTKDSTNRIQTCANTTWKE